MMLRAGAIRYVNFLPLFAAIELGVIKPPFQWYYDAPSGLNRALRHGELDISPISAAEYLAHTDAYTLLSLFCIGAVDKVSSVTLYSSCPVEQLDSRTIGLTAQSASSALLLKVLCHNLWKVCPRYQTFDDFNAHAQFDAFLLIGDDALLHPNLPGYHTIDLATAWYQLTALPFTFAVFAARKEVKDDQLDLFNHTLARSYQWAIDHPEAVLDLAQARIPLSRDDLQAYYQALRFPFTSLQQEGLARFRDLALALPETPLKEPCYASPGLR